MDYIEINRNSWNNRVETHVKSKFYNQEDFIKGCTSLNDIELNLLGDLKGKSVLHLQCHFGQDSISLSRLGANVTGIDLSDKAISVAKELAKETNETVEFICCNIYDLPNYLNKKFDIVYTSYGTIGWLPDLLQWANIVYTFLKPNGKFVFVEFHPVVWMYDDNFEKIAYNYFNTGAILENENGTYADKSADISLTNVNWNHSLGEVLSSLINSNLEIRSFAEYNYSPYNCFNNTIEVEKGKFVIEHIGSKIPIVFALTATPKV